MQYVFVSLTNLIEMFVFKLFQNCSSDGTGAVLLNGYQMLYGTETTSFLYNPIVYRTRGKRLKVSLLMLHNKFLIQKLYLILYTHK